jgi:hypothetical protein
MVWKSIKRFFLTPVRVQRWLREYQWARRGQLALNKRMLDNQNGPEAQSTMKTSLTDGSKDRSLQAQKTLKWTESSDRSDTSSPVPFPQSSTPHGL